jgi:phenylalanyl-tRNA synthetase beta chain
MKAVVDGLARQLSTVLLAYELGTPMTRMFHPRRSAVIRLGVKDIGYVGELHPAIRDQVLKTPESIVIFEINLKSLRKYERHSTRFKPLSKFPSSEIDLAFVVDREISSQSIGETIKQAGGNLLSTLSVFDSYEGEHVAAGKRSLAFRLNFQSPERTLTDDEVVGLKDKIIQSMLQKHSATLRS